MVAPSWSRPWAADVSVADWAVNSGAQSPPAVALSPAVLADMQPRLDEALYWLLLSRAAGCDLHLHHDRGASPLPLPPAACAHPPRPPNG
jgi:hypothetical protein